MTEVYRRHIASQALRWAARFSEFVASSKGRNLVEAPNLLTGMYISGFERIAPFWPTGGDLDDFVACTCGWNEPRWLSWYRWAEGTRKPRFGLKIPFTTRRLILQPINPTVSLSAECEQAYATAETIATNHVTWKGRPLPLLTVELLLLAMLKLPDSQFSDTLRKVDLNVAYLEKRATAVFDNAAELI